ncbi:MAG TPA: ABC transporter permease [Alphaproteobacteria bacterium]|nr:ABC transporter permease [Alphaproteobacteria bacterium]
MSRLAALDIDRPIAFACGFIVLILAAGTAYTLATSGTASFLSPAYLLQQLQVASFLGLVAAGMMIVILLGRIDLSVPWTLAAAAMMATAVGGPLAIPVGLGVGLLIGLVNGLGVAFLRVPSMIFTLGVNTVVQGLMVVHTGGFAPQSRSTGLMEVLAVGRILGVPVALLVWALVTGLLVFMLRRTPMGRYIYAVGNREAAAYLSGVNTRLVLIGAFVICSMCAALAGVLLAGYSTKAYQGMGDAYLLPSIAAVVIGGTNILGGKGRYAGTVAGAILIVLLQSVLSVMQMPEAGRQVIYGLVIIAMLFVYGRGEKVQA